MTIPNDNTAGGKAPTVNEPNVWIDLDNSPHVHFFAPIVRSLECHGVKYFITIRSYSQTEDLARKYGLKCVVIGEHRTPRHLHTRVTAGVRRAVRLTQYASNFKPTVAISHGSRGLTLASCWLRIPAMTFYDYEFGSLRFFNIVSKKVMVPAAIPAERLRRQGLTHKKLIAYPGFKEEVYLYDFRPDPGVLSELELDSNQIIVTLRPPATWAHYQDPRSEVLLSALLERLVQRPDVQVVIPTRTEAQAGMLRAKYSPRASNFKIFARGVDGLSLMWYSDAVFSGGGTMVREAAILGRTAYSIFAGKLGAADEALATLGLLKLIREEKEIDCLEVHKSPTGKPASIINSHTRDFVLREIHKFICNHLDHEVPGIYCRDGDRVS